MPGDAGALYTDRDVQVAPAQGRADAVARPPPRASRGTTFEGSHAEIMAVTDPRPTEGRTRRRAGLWIDHEQAILVALGGEGDAPSVRVIPSDSSARKKTRGTPGGSREAGGASHAAAAERRRQELRRFYRRVLDALRDVDAVAILGPGPAKHELEKEIERGGAPRFEVTRIEAADRMTERQLVARVRALFER